MELFFIKYIFSFLTNGLEIILLPIFNVSPIRFFPSSKDIILLSSSSLHSKTTAIAIKKGNIRGVSKVERINDFFFTLDRYSRSKIMKILSIFFFIYFHNKNIIHVRNSLIK